MSGNAVGGAIDLTHSSSDEDEEEKKAAAAVTPAPEVLGRGGGTARVIATASDRASFSGDVDVDMEEEEEEEEEQEQDDDDDDEGQREWRLLFKVSSETHRYCQLVGIRYYSGVAHPNEYVSLSREPSNPYDGNAVRVDNVRGEKVGHVKRELAAVLSPIMRRHCGSGTGGGGGAASAGNGTAGSDVLKIDGTIPSRGNAYNLPLMLEFYGLVRRGGQDDDDDAFADAESARLAELASRIEGQFDRFAFNNKKRAPAAAKKAPVVVHRKTVDWKEQQKHLDDLFEKQSKEKLANLPTDVVMPPPGMLATLLEHQVDGIRWLVSRERNVATPFYQKVSEKGRVVYFCEITHSSSPEPPEPVQGSILADDMGLGKTIQTLGLVLSNPPPGRDYSTPLVVGAAVATSTEKTADTSLPKTMPSKTAVKKVKLPVLQALLVQAGIATPGVSKKEQVVNSVMGGLDAGTITVEEYHAAVATAPPPASSLSPSSTNAGPGSQTTLIVCPVSVLGNWREQVEAHVAPNTLRVALYHGPDRKELLGPSLDSIDVLVCSYNTLQHDYSKDIKKNSNAADVNAPPPCKKFKGNSIFKHTFWRVVLDESHIIRNGKSRTFQACKSLQAKHRLCLTGTPLQNRPDDIQSLFSFLEVPPVENKDHFRRAISQPIMNGDDKGLSLLRAMMAHFALRRNKGAVSIALPSKVVELRSVEFPPGCKHKAVHDAIYDSAKAALKASIQGGDMQSLSHNSIFEILTRLRQACCSGKLVPVERLECAEKVLAMINSKESLTAEEGKELLEKLKGALSAVDDAPPDCAICMEALTENAAVVLRACGHVFCQVCLSKVATNTNCYGDSANYCPFCRHAFGKEDMIRWSSAEQAASASDGKSEAPLSQQDLGPSPKIEALLAAINEQKPNEKGVIFSQFTKFLDLVEDSMKASNMTYGRIDGKKTAAQRMQAMSEFAREEGGPDFMLCSLHAAGTGITLARANHIYMMDTWWNKAVETQAFDRVHRIGQKRPVRVVRFVTADSIESRMVELQEAKAAMGKGAFENLSAEEKKKARFGDVKKLLEL